MTPTGYRHPSYAAAFRELGTPVRLPRADGWMLRRRTPSGDHDLVGVYPLMVCRDLAFVASDLALVAGTGDASAVFVSDPFSDASVEEDLETFEVVRRFKAHHVVRLDDWRGSARRSARRAARRARTLLDIRRVDDRPSRYAAFWCLYRRRMDDLGVTGTARMSSASVRAQLAVPGVGLFEARLRGRTVGLATFAEVGDRVYGHLMGVSERGREVLATHGLFATAFDHYRERGFSALDLGGNPGRHDDPDHGISRFKASWGSEQRWTYLCGKVLDAELYRALVVASGLSEGPYFPAYRAPSSSRSVARAEASPEPGGDDGPARPVVRGWTAVRPASDATG